MEIKSASLIAIFLSDPQKLQLPIGIGNIVFYPCEYENWKVKLVPKLTCQ